MAEKSTFFNSVSGDRRYKAEDMAAHFAKVLTNGVMPAGTQLRVTESSGMNIVVSAGSAWINGYAYHNDSEFTLPIDPADGVLNRIDRVVVRWGRLARSINLTIIKGIPGSSAVAPEIVRSADYYDISLATISVSAGVTAISQALITDTRMDSVVCGFVSSLIQPDTSGWFAQFEAVFNSLISGKQSDWEAWFTTAKNTFSTSMSDNQSTFNATMSENQSDWDTWFATIKDALDGDTAGNLLNLINTKAAKGENSDITSLSALITALSVSQGGTGASTAAAARTNLDAAQPYHGTVTLAVASWSGSAAPYTYTLSITGMTADDNPYINVVHSSDEAANDTLDEAWAKAKIRAYTTAGAINIVARGDKPAVNIPIFWRGSR